MNYAEVSNEAELAVLEHLYETAYEMTIVVGNGPESDSVEEALFTLVVTKLDYITKKLYSSANMN